MREPRKYRIAYNGYKYRVERLETWRRWGFLWKVSEWKPVETMYLTWPPSYYVQEYDSFAEAQEVANDMSQREIARAAQWIVAWPAPSRSTSAP